MGAVILDRDIKPAQWGLDPGLVVPEWAWLWNYRHIFVPFWDGGGAPFAYGPDDFGALVNQADWQDTFGRSIDCPGSDDYVTFTRNFFPDGEGTVFIAFIPDSAGSTQILCYESDGTTTDYNGFTDGDIIREIHLGFISGAADFTYQDGVGAGDSVRATEASSTLTFGGVNTMAATWKAGGTHFLYVNGIQRASAASVSSSILMPRMWRKTCPYRSSSITSCSRLTVPTHAREPAPALTLAPARAGR